MKPWFKHGADWHENRKLVKIIMQTGYEGYGIYSVLLELILSTDGMLEISLQELNYLVRCETGLLKRVLTNYDLFDVKATDGGVLCISVDWLLKDIDKSKKTSQARSASGKKGLRSRYGAKKVSELANTVGVPNSDNLAKASQNVANAIANADFDERRLDIDKITTIKSDDINSSVECRKEYNARDSKNFEVNQKFAATKVLSELMPEMKEDKAWHGNLVAMLRQKGVQLETDSIVSLIDEFFQFQAARGKDSVQKTILSAKAWFFNWMLFQIEKTKENGKGNNRTSPASSYGGNQVTVVSTGNASGTSRRKSFAEQVRESKERLVQDTIEMLRNGEL